MTKPTPGDFRERRWRVFRNGADDGDSTAERFSDNPIDRIFDPPALTTEQLRKLAVLVGAQDAVDAVDRGDIDAAKSILAQLGHYGASVPLPPGL